MNTQGSDKQNTTFYNESSHKKNHQKAIASKFDKEFQQAVADMAFTKDPSRRNMPDTITYLEVIEILQHLKFVNQQNFEENQMIAIQVQRVWNQLSCRQDKTRILVRNLEVFLFAVLSIRADAGMIPFITEDQLIQEQMSTIHQRSKHLNPDDSSPQSQYNSQHQSSLDNMEKLNLKLAERSKMINSKLSESKRQAIGFFDSNDNLYYTDELVEKVHKKFKDIYDNRLTGEKGNRRLKLNTEPSHTFTPEISEASRRLALERRERVVEDLKRNDGFDGNLDINEILIYQKQLTKFQNDELKQKLDEEKMTQCTFHPQTKDFSKVEKYFTLNNNQNNFEDEAQGKMSSDRKGTTSTKPLGVQRTFELYSLAKPLNQRRDRNRDDIQYEKECDECTFSPDISHIKLAQFSSTNNSQFNSLGSPNKSKHLQYLQQKGVQKSIERVKSARVNSRVNQHIVKTGKTLSSKSREQIERIVHINLQNERCTHQRPEGRFISTNSQPNRYIQTSPQPGLYSPQETQDFNQNNYDHQENGDSARSGKSQQNQGDNQDGNEYFIKQPQQQGVEREKQAQPASKTSEEERVPLLFVDVNIEDGKTARIIVYEGEKSEDLAIKFATEHNLDVVMQGRLKDLLDQQINSLLTKIDEEVGSDRDEEEESGEDEQGNYIHRRKHNQHMIEEVSDQHQQDNQHDDYDEHDGESSPQNNQQHFIYTEDNFDFLSGQNRLNNPQLQHQDSDQVENVKNSQIQINVDGRYYENNDEQDENPEQYQDDKIKRTKNNNQADQNEKQRSQTDIEAMHLKALANAYNNYEKNENKHMEALAATFKNYSENPNKFNSEINIGSKSQIESHTPSNKYENQYSNPTSQTDVYKVTVNNYDSSRNKSATNESSKSPQNTMDMHMKAMATTYQNYSEHPDKFNSKNSNQQSSTSYKIVNNQSVNSDTSKSPQNTMDMHMKAMATTYQNYSEHPDKFNSKNSNQQSSNSYQIINNQSINSDTSKSPQNTMDMHMKAMAATHQNYSENPDKFGSQKSISNTYQINSYQSIGNEQPKSSSNIMDMHMKAMAASYQNYSEHPDKFNTQNTNKQYTTTYQINNNQQKTNETSKSPQDVMDMHMKAMSSTYQNYSQNPDKFNQTGTYQPSSQTNINNYTSSYTSIPPIDIKYNGIGSSSAIPVSPYGANSQTYISSYVTPSTQTYTGTSNIANVGSTSYNTYTTPSTTYGAPSTNTYGLSSTTTYGVTPSATGGIGSNTYTTTNYPSTSYTSTSYKY